MDKVSIKKLNELVASEKKPVFVKFATTWCGVCKLNAPIVEKVAKKYGDRVVFVEVDADTEKAWEEDGNSQFKVKLVPTYFLFKGGKPEWTQNNFVGEPVFEKVIDKTLSA